MKARLFTLLSLIAAMALLLPGEVPPTVAQVQPAAAAPTRAHATPLLQSTPVMFIENVSQFPAPAGGTGAERARFRVWGGGPGTWWLAEDAIWITLLEQQDQRPRTHDKRPVRDNWRSSSVIGHSSVKGVNLRLSFPGANPHPRLEPFDRLDTRVSYFIGNDPDQWRPDVPVWGDVRYKDLYPGLDLVPGAGLAPAQGRPQGLPLPWRLEVRDGADLSAVRLRLEGADTLTLDGDRLHLTTAVGDLTLSGDCTCLTRRKGDLW